MIAGLSPVGASSLTFAALAAALVLLAWSPWRRLFLPGLAAASLLVAASWLSAPAAAALAGFLVLPYWVAKASWGRPAPSALVVVATIAVQLVAFVLLKNYFDINRLLPWEQSLAIVGLSYILFRQVHLVLAAPTLGDLPLDPLRYCTWLLAFWTLLAGPIQRYPEFCRGLGEVGRPAPADALAAVHRCLNGGLKAFVLAPVFDVTSGGWMPGQGSGWLDFAVILYGFPVYMYLNFSGYTDLVVGVARLCRITTMPENFDRPYVARNLQDFWSRWHMSFSFWIRDYIFNPASMTVYRQLPPAWHGPGMIALVLVTFAVVGLWHGTTLSFLAFGLAQGIGVLVMVAWGFMVKKLLGAKGKKEFERRWFIRAAAWAITFHFVCATLLLVSTPLGDLATAAKALL